MNIQELIKFAEDKKKKEQEEESIWPSLLKWLAIAGAGYGAYKLMSPSLGEQMQERRLNRDINNKSLWSLAADVGHYGGYAGAAAGVGWSVAGAIRDASNAAGGVRAALGQFGKGLARRGVVGLPLAATSAGLGYLSGELSDYLDDKAWALRHGVRD